MYATLQLMCLLVWYYIYERELVAMPCPHIALNNNNDNNKNIRFYSHFSSFILPLNIDLLSDKYARACNTHKNTQTHREHGNIQLNVVRMYRECVLVVLFTAHPSNSAFKILKIISHHHLESEMCIYIYIM